MVFQVSNPHNRRTAQRYSCSSLARVHTGAFDFSCRVIDISSTGAKVAVAPSLIGSFRSGNWDLVVEDIGRIPAQKIWQRGSEFGLAFVQNLSKQTALEKTLNELAKTGALKPLEG